MVYIFPREAKQVMCLSKSDFTETGLIEIAPLSFWEMNFPVEKRTGSTFDRQKVVDYVYRQYNAFL